MAQRITAVFPDPESLSIAVSQLRAEGFSHVFPPGNPEGDPTLMVEAPFGKAAKAIGVLKASGALDIREGSADRARDTGHPDRVQTPGSLDCGETSRHVFPQDESFYVSSVFGLPLLIDEPAPLSSLLGLPTLIRT